MKKLSRNEMKNVVGGLKESASAVCSYGASCSYYESGTGQVSGDCSSNSRGNCVCIGPNSSIVANSQCGSQQ